MMRQVFFPAVHERKTRVYEHAPLTMTTIVLQLAELYKRDFYRAREVVLRVVNEIMKYTCIRRCSLTKAHAVPQGRNNGDRYGAASPQWRAGPLV